MSPWLNEPDKLDWTDEKTGYDCRILRVKGIGHLCGYVRVPPTHPLAGLDYSAPLPENLRGCLDAVMAGPVGKRGSMNLICFNPEAPRLDILFDVHGSLTFAGKLRETEGWWFGFDCGHAGDLCPETAARYGAHDGGIYRDLAYVKAECTSLADQLSKVAM